MLNDNAIVDAIRRCERRDDKTVEVLRTIEAERSEAAADAYTYRRLTRALADALGMLVRAIQDVEGSTTLDQSIEMRSEPGDDRA